MTYKKETFEKLYEIFNKVEKTIKRKNASEDHKTVKAREYLIIYSFNLILKQVKYCNAIESLDKTELKKN